MSLTLLSQTNFTQQIAEWETKFKAAASARMPFEEQWYYNMAFYFGRQWAVWEKGTLANRLIEPPQPRNRVRLVINKTRRAVRTEQAKLLKEMPQWYCEPMGSDPEDAAAAEAAVALGEYAMDKGHFQEVRRKNTFWLSICGSSFYKVYCPDYDADIVYESVTPFHLYVPYLQLETVEEQPWVIHAKAVSPEEIEKRYNVQVRPDTLVSGSTLEQRFFNALGIKTSNKEANKNLTYLKEIWVKPGYGGKYPNGALIAIANGKILYQYSSTRQGMELQDKPIDSTPSLSVPSMVGQQDAYPYTHGKFPYIKVDHIPSGRFYADSMITDLIPLQKEYNRNRSQMIEVRNRNAKPMLAFFKGSIDPSKVTSEPGAMLPVNPGFDKPTYIDVPAMGALPAQDLEVIQRDMDDLSNKFDIPGVMSASAISFIHEENDSVYQETVTSIEAAVSECGRQSLQLMQQFWSPTKMVKIVSKNESFEAQEFQISDIQENYNIKVEAGSMQPMSRAAKQAFIMDMMKGGFLTPEQGLRYLNMAETNRLWNELRVDAKQAQRENAAMSKGTLVERNPFDNDAAHIYEHGLYMKSQAYELLDDTAQTLFLQHYQEHVMGQSGTILQQQALQTNQPLVPHERPMPTDQNQPTEGQPVNA